MNTLRIAAAVLFCLPALAVRAQSTPPAPAEVPMVRICDDTGCSDRPRNSATFRPPAGDPAEEQRIAALTALAERDPRAAFDLGLRFFRGDGVRRNSYEALHWMREAGDRGHVPAQLALGRLYLSGYEEMGSDPAEAEKWLTLAAGRGDKEAARLLRQASQAKNDEIAYRRWVDLYRASWYGSWVSGYHYYWVWRDTRWILP